MSDATFDFPPDYRALDPGVVRELVGTHALDGYPLHGTLYLPPGTDPRAQLPGVALLAMHPRADFSRHYCAPKLALGGYAFFGCNTRYLNNDADALHERLLLDVGGAIRWLRARGFDKVVLLGNSGGGGLFAYYLQQASRPAAERFTSAPSGDRVPLADHELPGADGFAIVAAHAGEGRFLLERLDPSVVDEANPSAVDPAFDLYDPRNGYRPMALGPSSYSTQFLAEFRAAQRARAQRLDRLCLEWCEEAAYWKKRLKEAMSGASGSTEDRVRAARHALPRRYLVIYRTLADPRYLDPTLEPSRRPLGSIFATGGRDPVAGNYGEGLARAMSARGWLSTWSGLSSRAALDLTLPEVTQPLLVVYADADTEIYESECRHAHAVAASADKTFATVEWADHYLNSLGAEGARLGDGRERLCRQILLPWLRERWAV